MIGNGRVLLALGAFVLVTSGVVQAQIPATAPCSNAKMKCGVNYLKGKLGVAGKAAKGGVDEDLIKAGKVDDKFSGLATSCIEKADAKYPGALCPQAGDGGLKGELDALIGNLKTQLYTNPASNDVNPCFAGQTKCVSNLYKGLVGADSKALKSGLFTDVLALDKALCKFDDSVANAAASPSKCLGLAKGCMQKLDAPTKACTTTGLPGQAASVQAQVIGVINRATCEQSPTAATLEMTTQPGGGTCGATNGPVNPTLTCGSLYLGDSSGSTPPGATPAGSLNVFDLAGGKDRICPRTQAEQGSGNEECTAPGCFFGSPLPIINGGLSTCVINTIATNGYGEIRHFGKVTTDVLLSSKVTVTGNATQPCPHCVGGVCDATAANAGASCDADATSGESHDCTAAGTALPAFNVNLVGLTTGTSSKTDAGGIFCPAEGQTNPGAFGDAAVTTFSETGTPAGDITSGAALPADLGATFCVPATGNVLIDGAAGLPGPGAISLVTTLQVP